MAKSTFSWSSKIPSENGFKTIIKDSTKWWSQLNEMTQL